MPENQDENEIKREISKIYNEILKRNPDSGGLQFYFEKIKKNNLKFEDLKKILEKSEEYFQLINKEKFWLENQNMLLTKLSPTNEYIESSMKQIDGWLTSTSARVITSLSEIQTNLKLIGGLGEIGVHHGKLFILLTLLSTKREKTLCIDVFEMQELNIDKSGKGSFEILMNNLKKFGNGNSLNIIKNSSLNVTHNEIIERIGKVRLFSIDGGHTKKVVYNDLKLIEKSLMLGGIIILDDFFNPSWPGVSEGTYNFFSNENTNLIPFAVSPNKVYFTNTKDFAKQYQDLLSKQFSKKIIKTTEFLGNTVVVIGE